jgi:mannose-6-phosphate isomerase
VRVPVKLAARAVEKPWGRKSLPAPFGGEGVRRIGEIWFEGTDDAKLPLLVKYIFTSERLSIQVHPSDSQAAARGLPAGKEECWYILDCAPGAKLGLGLTQAVSRREMESAVADDRVESLIEWKPVRPGDFFSIPTGTVHAIGAGIALVEVQQNADITYRLYDYGRPRELHLEEALAVSTLSPFDGVALHAEIGSSTMLVPPGIAPFTVQLRSWAAGEFFDMPATGPLWFVPLKGAGSIDGQDFDTGECWVADRPVRIRGADTGSALIARPAAAGAAA